jgi:hypothetical protein
MDQSFKWAIYKIDQPLFFTEKDSISSITDNSKNLGQQSTIHLQQKLLFFLQTVMILKPYYNQKTAMESIKEILQCLVQKLFYKLGNNKQKNDQHRKF